MEQRKRFYVALAIYAVLGLAVWFTMSDLPLPVPVGLTREGGSLMVIMGHVGIRSLTLVVLGMFTLRTILHWRAEHIRSQQEQEKVSS